MVAGVQRSGARTWPHPKPPSTRRTPPAPLVPAACNPPCCPPFAGAPAQVSGVVNLSSEAGAVGLFFVTGLRLVWFSAASDNFNVSIPYLQVGRQTGGWRSVEWCFGMCCMAHSRHRYTDEAGAPRGICSAAAPPGSPVLWLHTPTPGDARTPACVRLPFSRHCCPRRHRCPRGFRSRGCALRTARWDPAWSLRRHSARAATCLASSEHRHGGTPQHQQQHL